MVDFNVIASMILAPSFLASRIGIISYIFAAAILVIFSDIVMRSIIFPFADWVKEKIGSKILNFHSSKKVKFFAKYFSEALATAIFLFYCWMGSNLLSEYILAPIIFRLKSILLIVVLIMFFLVSYSINRTWLRRQLFDCMKHR